MAYIPFIGSLALSSATVLEKGILKKKGVGTGLYFVVSFLAVCIAMLPLLYFFWKVDAQAFTLKNVLIFVGVITSAVIANYLALSSLKWEKITRLEPARIIEPLFVIVLSIILSFFMTGVFDVSVKVVIPALIASLAIVFPHIKKERLCFNKYFIMAIAGSFFFALELILSKFILEFYSPIAFYFVRCVFVGAIGFVIFRPNLKEMDKKLWGITLLTGAIWVVYRIVVYFSYVHYGVIHTTLILMTSPIFIYIFANRFLKEKLNWKNILSSIIIIACVVYVLLTE